MSVERICCCVAGIAGFVMSMLGWYLDQRWFAPTAEQRARAQSMRLIAEQVRCLMLAAHHEPWHDPLQGEPTTCQALRELCQDAGTDGHAAFTSEGGFRLKHSDN